MVTCMQNDGNSAAAPVEPYSAAAAAVAAEIAEMAEGEAGVGEDVPADKNPAIG